MTALSYGADDISDVLYRDGGITLNKIISSESINSIETCFSPYSTTLSRLSSNHYLSIRRSSTRSKLRMTIHTLSNTIGSLYRLLSALFWRLVHLGDDVRPCLSWLKTSRTEFLDEQKLNNDKSLMKWEAPVWIYFVQFCLQQQYMSVYSLNANWMRKNKSEHTILHFYTCTYNV